MLKTILNLIIPPRCLCGDIVLSEHEYICEKCWKKAGIIATKAICETCGDPFSNDGMVGTKCANCISEEPNFDMARAVFKYNDINGQMIAGLKYADRTPFAKPLASLMSNRLKEMDQEYDLIVSVPIHRKKLLKRKFNHAALLANRIAKLQKHKVNNLVLRKTKDIAHQATLTRKERIKNIKGSIEVDAKFKSLINGRKILLVDDVITTGATANECAKVLKKAGAAQVYLITAARTMLEQ